MWNEPDRVCVSHCTPTTGRNYQEGVFLLSTPVCVTDRRQEFLSFFFFFLSMQNLTTC